ncbi:MAG: hypothetical protein AAGF25_02660 [Pseudomonadota bacterium]
MKKSILLSVALSTFLAGCITTIQSAKKFGVYEFDGVEYDVYSANINDDRERPHLLIVEKGKDPVSISGLNIIATCDREKYKQIAECEREFGKVLERRKRKVMEKQESSSSY